MSFSAKVDFKKHEASLGKLHDEQIKAVKGILKNELAPLQIDDAVNIEPKPFLDTSFLQGSSFALVTGEEPVINPLGLQSEKSGPLQKPPTDGMTEPLHLRIGFLAEYAIYLHDNPDATPRKISNRKDVNGNNIIKKASMEGRGPFWLSSKTERFTNSVYIPFVQKRLNQEMQGKKF